MQATHYQVLGIGNGATLEEIEAAYRSALQRLRQQLTDQTAPGPEFLDALRLAYKTLIHPAAREAYDQSLTPFPAAASIDERPASAVAVPIADEWVRSPEDAESTRYAFRFTGDGAEYFRIWIVNLLLSVLTLGIYSAWAKVRREQYFHRNLLLDGSGFDYHARPVAILKGRLLALLLFVVFSASENFGAAVHGLVVLALLPLVPWLVVRAFRFRAHNTSYRGLRFSFHGGYREALTVFVGYGLLAGITLGLCFPLWYRKQRQFLLDNLQFGTTSFRCAIGIWPVYRIFLMPLAALLVAVVAVAVTTAGLGTLPKGQAQAAMAITFAVVVVTFFAAQLVLIPYIQLRTTNLVWNGTTLGPHRTESSMTLRGYLGVVVVNWLLTVITLGLFWPWAKVRLAKYRAENLALVAAGSLDDFVAGAVKQAAAVGDEVAEMFDVDVGL